MGKFYQCIQSYGPSFMTKFCAALYIENLFTNIFAKLNLRGGVSCMPAALLFPLEIMLGKLYQFKICQNPYLPREIWTPITPPYHTPEFFFHSFFFPLEIMLGNILCIELYQTLFFFQ